MARMTLRPRRDAPGVSVFWMILAAGAGVFVLVAIFVYASQSGTQVEPAEPEIIAGEGDEPPGTSSFSEGEVAEEPAPPDVPGEADEGDESAPANGQADGGTEAGAAAPGDVDPAAPAPDDAAPEPATGEDEPATGEAEPAQ